MWQINNSFKKWNILIFAGEMCQNSLCSIFWQWYIVETDFDAFFVRESSSFEHGIIHVDVAC